jgi:hypothetical protein
MTKGPKPPTPPAVRVPVGPDQWNTMLAAAYQFRENADTPAKLKMADDLFRLLAMANNMKRFVLQVERDHIGS